MTNNIYKLLREMAETLLVVHPVAGALSDSSDSHAGLSKATLTVPFGIDFATWRDQEQRKLDHIADATLAN